MNRLARFLDDYSHRFAPTLFARILRSDLSQIPKTLEVATENLDLQIRSSLQKLEDEFPNINFHRNPDEKACEEAKNVLFENLGFELKREKSHIPQCGKGVFVNRGHIEKGRVVCMYPGTVYDPWDALLLQSIGNQFILKCGDGVAIDGNDRRLSKFIFRSCARRDLSPFVCDLSWLAPSPFNFLALGQYVNNASSPTSHNVQYMDLDIRGWPYHLRKFLPYAVYNPQRTCPLRIILLVSTRRIEEGEELYSAYVST